MSQATEYGARRVLGAEVVAVDPELHPGDADVVARVRGDASTTPLSVAPAAGAVIETVGGVVSAVDDCARLVGGRADVARRVLGDHLVVVGAGGDAGVGVARARRLRDPVRGRAA